MGTEALEQAAQMAWLRERVAQLEALLALRTNTMRDINAALCDALDRAEAAEDLAAAALRYGLAECEQLRAEIRRTAVDYLSLDGQAMELWRERDEARARAEQAEELNHRLMSTLCRVQSVAVCPVEALDPYAALNRVDEIAGEVIRDHVEFAREVVAARVATQPEGG